MSVSSPTPLAAWPTSTADLRRRVVVVTGANSGVGFSAARELAVRGSRIVMVCRDRTRGESAQARIAEATSGARPDLLLADLSSQAEVHRVAAEIDARYDRVDVLLNNAGGVFARRELTVDGIEKTLATNHLAPFLLTHLLLHLLIAAPAGRVVAVASEAYSRKLDLDNLQGERSYTFLGAYNRSKLANVLFTNELSRRLSGSGVTANAVSPGPARTHFGDNMRGLPGLFPKVMKRMPFFASPEKAARTLVYAASAPELDGISGRFYLRSREKRLKPIATDAAAAARLWRVSEGLCRLDTRTSAVTIVATRSGEQDE